MMANPAFHKVHISILYSLRHVPAARFSELMRPTGLQSDDFKFYLRKLVNLGYVEKQLDGLYVLTAAGKELANNLDDTKQAIQKQPKLSLMVIARRLDENGATEFLLQKRLRNPFYGFWGAIGGPAQWGEDFEQTARAELHKQTGLTAQCTVRSFCRTRDYDRVDSGLLEDKLFVLIEATDIEGGLQNTWHGGHNQWMTLAECRQQERYFDSGLEIIETMHDGLFYTTQDVHYPADVY